MVIVTYHKISASETLQHYAPMQSERVQKSGQSFHKQQNGDCKKRPGSEEHEHGDAADVTLARKPDTKHHVPQNFRQLCARVLAHTHTQTIITGSIGRHRRQWHHAARHDH